jgi:hypothetical protein
MTKPHRQLGPLKKLVLAPLFIRTCFLICVKTVAQERKTETKKSIRQLRLLNKKYFENTILQLKTRMEILSPKKDSLN